MSKGIAKWRIKVYAGTIKFVLSLIKSSVWLHVWTQLRGNESCSLLNLPLDGHGCGSRMMSQDK